MKLAVLFRGPIRPGVEAVAEKVALLTGELRARGVEHDAYLATWADQDGVSLDALAALCPGMTTLLLRQPAEAFILARTANRHGLAPKVVRNAYWQYHMSKIAIEAIIASGRYDHIVHSRTDLAMRLGEHLDAWLRPGGYHTIHIREDGFVNDQFAVAEPEIMRRAWSPMGVEDLCGLLDASDKPEEVLQALISRAGIEARKCPFELWELDGHRHAAAA